MFPESFTSKDLVCIAQVMGGTICDAVIPRAAGGSAVTTVAEIVRCRIIPACATVHYIIGRARVGAAK